MRANPEFLITGLGSSRERGGERGKRELLHDLDKLTGRLKSRSCFHVF
jgi:hypothetical protein